MMLIAYPPILVKSTNSPIFVGFFTSPYFFAFTHYTLLLDSSAAPVWSERTIALLYCICAAVLSALLNLSIRKAGNGHFPPGQFPLPTRTIPPHTTQNPTLKLHIYIHVCTHAYIYTYMHIHKDACTHVYTHTIHTCMHTDIYSCIVIHLGLKIVIYIDIFWHNYTYMYTYIHK